MLYIENSNTDPYFNQAFEQTIFESIPNGDILLVWRNSPAVVCGKNQNVFAEADVLSAMRKKVAVVRRDTGGGTVYHDMGNVNYTLICDSHGLSVDYDIFITKVVSALNRIGVPAHKNNTCDIAIDGLKISGSAQMQTKTRILHHGTLLFDTDLDALKSFSADRSSNFTSKAVGSNRCSVTNISLHTAKFSRTEDFMQAFTDAMLTSKDERLSPTSDMLHKAQSLAESKYKDPAWLYGKNPSFSCVKELSGIRLEMASKRGIITKFEVFSEEYRDVLSELFSGRLLEPQGIRELCENVCNSHEQAQKLLELIFR